jgi:hypothetical protein
MAQEQKRQTESQENRIDEVGKSGVYPVSAMENASGDATVHGEASWGQGERGAAGYEDAGSSEIFYLDEERETGNVKEENTGLAHRGDHRAVISQAASGAPHSDSDISAGATNANAGHKTADQENEKNG